MKEQILAVQRMQDYIESHLEESIDYCYGLDCIAEMANYCYDTIVPAMRALRDPIDRLELTVDKDIWPVPTYGDLMFEV